MHLPKTAVMKTVQTFLFLLLQVYITSGWKPNNEPITSRMYGSRDAVDGQFPYVTFHLVDVNTTYVTCTGNIIHKKWVLTAAHCVKPGQNPQYHIVVAGNVDLGDYMTARLKRIPTLENIDERKYKVQERRAIATYIHPNFKEPGRHDVCLVKLRKSFIFNKRVQAIALPTKMFQSRRDCSLAGYGFVENNIRRYHLEYITQMSAKPSELCKYQTTTDIICLGDTARGICGGDSGGPLICGGVLTGVASYGSGTSLNCGEKITEQYFVDVEQHNLWISAVRYADNYMLKTST